MSIAVTVDGTSVTLLNSTQPQIRDTLDQRSIATFTIYDAKGTLHIQYGQQVTITDSYAGLVFAGYVDVATEKNLPPNAANTIDVKCFDQHYLADKRVSQTDYTNMFAGDIVTDLLSNYLAEEGVTAAYAERRDTTLADFQAGTLSNVVAANNVGDGNLELAPSGTTVSLTENTQSQWNSGFLLNLVANANNTLTLASSQSVKLQGTSQQGFNNSYVYNQIWFGGYTIASGDVLSYDVWVSSTSPLIQGGIDGICSDNTSLRDYSWTVSSITYHLVDQQNMRCHPGTDLSGFANDQWYSRSIDLSQLAGKTLKQITVALEGDNQGTYTAYFRHIKITNGGTTQVSIFETSLVANGQVSNNGYNNVSCTQVTAYQKSGLRISSAATASLASAGIVKNSIISWVADTTPPPGTSLFVDTSYDGASWQPCTNHAPIPDLVPGLKTANLSLLTRVRMVLGQSPELSPTLSSLSWTVQPSYACTKTDVSNAYQTTSQWGSGTLTNLQAANNALSLSGFWRNWDDASMSSQALWGTGTPTQSISAGQFVLGCTGNVTDARSQLSFVGNYQNFTLEVDISTPNSTLGSAGVVYRTTTWSNTNNTFGYIIYIDNAHINFGRGVNSTTSPAFTSIQVTPLFLNVGDLHRLKIVVNGNSHTAYIDGVQYINSTDSTFPNAGGIGLRFFNQDAASNFHSATFDNFGIVNALTGTWVSTATSIAPVGTVGTSVIHWTQEAGASDSVFVFTSTDNITYYQAFSGQYIPTLVPGTPIAAGTNLWVKVTMTVPTAAAEKLLGNDGFTYLTPTLNALSWYITGQLSASGYRIAPALNLSPVGRAGSTLVDWNGVMPANTDLEVDTSLDSNAWTNIGAGASGNGPVGGITAQTAPIDDTFDSNTSGFYSSTFQTNGSPATWDFSTATPTTSYISASGGSQAQLLYNGLLALDVDLVADMGVSDAGGLVWRLSDSNNFYDLTLGDPQSPTPSTMTLCSVVNGSRATLATTSIPWTQSTDTSGNAIRGSIAHRIRVTMLGATMTVYFDGTQLLTYTDNFPQQGGIVGLRTDTVSGASSANFYKFRVQPQGDSVVGQFVFTKVRMSSTDPTATPQLTDLTTSVRSPAIGNGAFIPSTAYSVLNGSTNTIAQDFDDLAKQSQYWWRIKNKALSFQPQNGTLTPFLITGADMLLGSGVSVKRAGDLYRNTPWILGGTDNQVFVQKFPTDGFPTDFTTDYPIELLNSLFDGTRSYTIGIKGVDAGKDFYFQLGSNTFNQDPSENPLPPGLTLEAHYLGQINVVATTQDASEVANQARLENTSGIVEVAETAQGLNKDAAAQFAAAREVRYTAKPETVTFTTFRTGLAVGQLAGVFLPQHALVDWEGLITDVTTWWRMDKGIPDRGYVDATPYFTVTATSGAIFNSWAATLAGTGR